jgi:hypothetical protein
MGTTTDDIGLASSGDWGFTNVVFFPPVATSSSWAWRVGLALSGRGRARARAHLEAMSEKSPPFVLYTKRPTRRAGSRNLQIGE